MVSSDFAHVVVAGMSNHETETVNNRNSLSPSAEKKKKTKTKQLSLNTLPDEIFEVIIKHAVDYDNGEIPLHYLYLTSVNRRFRTVIHTFVTHMKLTTEPTPIQRQRRQPPASHFLTTVLPHYHQLYHLDISSCHTLHDKPISIFFRKRLGGHGRQHSNLNSLSLSICMYQTSNILDDISLSVSRQQLNLHTLSLSGCDKNRHDSNSNNKQQQEFHPCTILRDDSTIRLLNRLSSVVKNLTLSRILSLTDKSLKKLSTLKKLECITLQRLTGITDRGIVYLSHGLFRLKSLEILSCSTLTDDTLYSISSGRATRNLERFKVSHLHRITSNGMKKVICTLQHLNSIVCDKCSGVTQGFGNNINNNSEMKNMEEIRFNGIVGKLMMNSINLKCMLGLGGFKLRRLDLSFISGLNTSCIQIIHSTCPFISKMILQGCADIDDESIFEIKQFQNLKYIDMSHCISISTFGLYTLVNQPLHHQIIGPQCMNGRLNDRFIMSDILNHGSGVANVGNDVAKRLKVCTNVDQDFLRWLKEFVFGLYGRSMIVDVSHLIVKYEKCHNDNSTSSKVNGNSQNVPSSSSSSERQHHN